jgi:hypothetical protein
VVTFTPLLLYPKGKSSWYPYDRRLSGPQGRSGRGVEGKYSQLLQGLELPIIQPVVQCYTTEVSRLLHALYFPVKTRFNPKKTKALMMMIYIHTHTHIYLSKLKIHLFPIDSRR